MKKLIFATNNPHKLEEVRAMLAGRFEIVSLAEAGCFEDIPETADTIEGNALMKAEYVYGKYHADCFADDTGLEIDALNGEPGVYSARYAGETKNPVDNMNKVLTAMQGVERREAAFRTVIALVLSGKRFTFEGKITGHIAGKPSGKGGFGYDPVFVPDGYAQTFAELGGEEKNKISHRALAVGKLVQFLVKN